MRVWRWGVLPFLFSSFTFPLFRFVKTPSWDWRDSCQSSCLWCPGSAYLLIPHHLPASQGLLVIARPASLEHQGGIKILGCAGSPRCTGCWLQPWLSGNAVALEFPSKGDPRALLPLWSQRDTDLTVNNEKELDFLCYAAHWMRFPTSVEVTTSFMRFDCQQDVMNPRC